MTSTRKQRLAEFRRAIETARPNRKLVRATLRKLSRYTLRRSIKRIVFHKNLLSAYKADVTANAGWMISERRSWREVERQIENENPGIFDKGGHSYSVLRRMEDAYTDDPKVGSKASAMNQAHAIAWASLGVGRGRDSFVTWERAWRSTLSNKPNFLSLYLKVLQGGCFIFWPGRTTVQVVLGTVHVEGGRVHRTDGPAIEYEDGSGVWCWQGVAVPKQVVLHPESLVAERILREPNAEVRRVMIERYGQERLVCDTWAKVLDREGENELVSIPLWNDPEQSLVALKLRCSSTGAVYVLRVPPDQREVHSALAWTFGFKSGQGYRPQVET